MLCTELTVEAHVFKTIHRLQKFLCFAYNFFWGATTDAILDCLYKFFLYAWGFYFRLHGEVGSWPVKCWSKEPSLKTHTKMLN